VQYVIDKVFEASTFDLSNADGKEMTDHEIKTLKTISKEQGLNLETMTPEQFEGKMPFSSYYELFASVQNDSWDRLCGYLLGREYAEKSGVGYTMEQYRDDIDEYVKFWHETKENAEKINTYEYSEILFYVNYYYNKVKEYVTENFFKEEKLMAIQYADDESFKEQIKEGFVIVDFFSTTCVPCKAFSRILEELDAELPFIH